MSRIKELEEKITQARKDYYNGQSTISDKLFDALVDELALLDPKNFAVVGIGSDPVSNWEKYTHVIPMGSLNKTQTDEEYLKWHDKYISDQDKILLTLKLDGLSVSVMYEAGNFVKAATRGSGVTGELITPNVAKMIGIPLRLPEKIDITVRGEILLSKENHQKHFPTYSNPRNAASGISRRYDGDGSDKLTVLIYQLFSDDLDIKTQEEQFQKLESLGFLVPTYYILNSSQEIIDLKNQYQTKLRDDYGFELDGMVAHNNDLEKQDTFGFLNGRPYASIAIKFDHASAVSTLVDVMWQVGNSGRITPVAVFEPVVIDGAEIRQASLHNAARVEELQLYIGCSLLISRRNGVIPFVEERL
jgi:DNA ligase (NAD+)